MQVTQTKNELIKHSAAVHISNNLSLLERKLSNILLNRALSYIAIKDEHVVSIREICEDLEIPDNKNYEMLKKALKELSNTQVEWNVLNKDKKNVWGVSSIIASAEFENGICTYSYSAAMKKIFSNPNIYAKLNMAIQAKFNSKYSIALWEYIMEFLSSGSSNNSDIIKNSISIDKMRKLLGIENSKYYAEFSNFNREILKKSIEEIKQVSSLEVEVNYVKRNKRVEAIEFSVKRPTSANGVLITESAKSIVPRTSEESKVIDELVDKFSFSEVAAETLINEYDLERIRLVMDYARKQSPKNYSAYIKKALKEQWTINSENNRSHANDEDIKRENSTHINNFPDESFRKVLFELQKRYDNAIYKSWFQNFSSILIQNQGILTIYLTKNNTFTKEWLKNHYSYQILEACQMYYDNVSEIKFD